MARKERVPELDIFRAIATLGVLAIHGTSQTLKETLNTSLFHPFLFINKFSSFAVPVFVFLSGFVLFYNYIDKPFTLRTLGRFYAKRLAYIVIPYLLFSVLYTALKLSATSQWDLPAMEIAAKLWKYVYTGKAYAHLYFLVMVIQLYVLFPLFLWCFQKSRLFAGLAPLLGLGFQWGFIVLNKYMTLQGYWELSRGSLAFSYFSYFLFGAAAAVFYPAWKQQLEPTRSGWKSGRWRVWVMLWLVWLGAGIVHVELWYYSYAHNFTVNSLWHDAAINAYALLSCVVLYQLSCLLHRASAGRLPSMLKSLGAYSFGIYLIHPVVLYLYRAWSPQGGTPAVYAAVIAGGMAAALFGSWCLVAVAFRFVPQAWMLFGSPPGIPLPRNKTVCSGEHSSSLKRGKTSNNSFNT